MTVLEPMTILIKGGAGTQSMRTMCARSNRIHFPNFDARDDFEMITLFSAGATSGLDESSSAEDIRAWLDERWAEELRVYSSREVVLKQTALLLDTPIDGGIITGVCSPPSASSYTLN